MSNKFILLAAAATTGWAAPALAKAGDPIALSDGVTFDPMVSTRLRYETVGQESAAEDADALTVRLRLGAEVKAEGFSFLAEGEGTLALVEDYNDTLPGNGVEPFPVIADPENLELNRLQVSYKQGGSGVTLGRQRIILDNARFVGNVGWRQNEQTFDAVRGEAKLGPVALDATYAISQRTIFGTDSPNEYFDGDIVLLNAAADLKPVTVTGFAYLVDYDTRVAFSSQTFGISAAGSFPIGESLKLSVAVSYATQSDMGANPVSYDADYLNLEAGLGIKGFTLKAGYEELGTDGGTASFQTPLATLHAFNGWADLFLTTPAAGLRDYYASASYGFPQVTALPGLKLAVTYHKFESDMGGSDYGSEIDASLGFKVGPVSLLAKYADYDADLFGADTQKFWLQAEYGF